MGNVIYIAVQFRDGGKEYIYSSPVIVKRGQLVLLGIYDKLSVATVTRKYKKNPLPGAQIHSIIGLAWMLEELHAPEAPDEAPVAGLVSTVKSFITGD